MKYEESVANINKDGKQSCILELKPELCDLLDNIVTTIDEDFAPNVPVLDILLILAGECCEGDYIVVSEDDEEHDAEALYDVVVKTHGYKLKDKNGNELTEQQSIDWFKEFIAKFKIDYGDGKGCLRKRLITWG
jgi:hypothetical protein